MLSVVWLRIDSANTLAKFTSDVFCEVIVTPMGNDKSGTPYPQQIRRTSIVKKADSTQNDYLMWYNDFQFGSDPAFKIRLHSPKFKVEVVVYHQVQGIRVQQVCAGYCKSANREEMMVELFDTTEGDSKADWGEIGEDGAQKDISKLTMGEVKLRALIGHNFSE